MTIGSTIGSSRECYKRESLFHYSVIVMCLWSALSDVFVFVNVMCLCLCSVVCQCDVFVIVMFMSVSLRERESRLCGRGEYGVTVDG